MSQMFKISELIPHKDNDFFFDDITGEAWQAFVDSIKTSGVIEPIIITPDKVIVSGHQRVRACKALGIEEIQGEVRIIDSEDELLKQLIETNIRQRGIGNTNPVKLGRCLKELERIYGIHQGNGSNQHEQKPNISAIATQEDLANQLGISVDTIQNYKQLADMIPEMQDLVETGIVTPTTARAVVRQLPEFQQKELAEQLSEDDRKKTQKRVQDLINTIKEKDNEIKRLESQEPQKIKVFPGDYDELRDKASLMESYKRESQQMKSEYQKMAEKWKKEAAEKEKLLKEKNDPDTEYDEQIRISASSLCAGMSNFLEKYGGYAYLMNELDRLSDRDKNAIEAGLRAMISWTNTMLNETVSEVIE